MKKIYLILTICILSLSCNTEDANDCFQTSGNFMIKEVAVADFSKIEVNEGIDLVVKQGNEAIVILESGSNLINDVEAKVENETLILTDNNDCNYVRDYRLTTIYVTAPNITEIRSKTQFDVRSDGVLTFPELRLISQNFDEPNVASGNFYLDVANQRLSLVFNNLSNLFISGSTNNFKIDLPGGNSRIEAENFLADTIDITSRSSNDIIINPQLELLGNIYGTGDVISFNRPTTVNFTAHYTGELIYQD